MPFPVDNIRAACAENGITLAELERAIGMGNGVIGKWEKMKGSPPHERLMQIADYLGTTVEVLEGIKKDPGTKAGVSAKDMRLIRWFRSLPPEKQKAILTAQDAPKDVS